ncbi:MAG: rfaE2 [Sphingobacterium sp.]|jgi:rfaE bifunctional protein nucleotidyltransferase chain/domain|nr:rfaE2 [Sphingobacterium sp.]
MDSLLNELLNNKVLSWDRAIESTEVWKKERKKIVFTNGCFDILHPGHLCYLMEAASLGDKLLVAINSDEIITELKGIGRPVNNEYFRSSMLASLYFVDGIIVFNDDTPKSLILSLKPDILVKGGDYDLTTIVGSKEVIEQGGSVKSLSYISGYSTSAIIKKIQKSFVNEL